jgi:hypothetical protein
MRFKQHLIGAQIYVEPARIDATRPISPLFRIRVPVNLGPRRARDDDPVYYTT